MTHKKVLLLKKIKVFSFCVINIFKGSQEVKNKSQLKILNLLIKKSEINFFCQLVLYLAPLNRWAILPQI